MGKKKNKKAENKNANCALCPSDFPDCPDDCKMCYDILSLNQGDCRACWEHYFNRTQKGWSERELKNQTVFVNSEDLMGIIEHVVEDLNSYLEKDPKNSEIKDIKLFILEELYKKRVISNPVEAFLKQIKV